jgi:hypothetical protein
MRQIVKKCKDKLSTGYPLIWKYNRRCCNIAAEFLDRGFNMSVISNIHTAVVYEAKTTKAFEGQRLCKVIAKADKDGNYGPHLQQTMAVSIPVLGADELVDALNDDALQGLLMPHLVEFLQGVQDSLIAEKIKAGTKTITSEELGIGALVNYLDADSVGDKWTPERIASWFENVVAEGYLTMLMSKGVDDEIAAGMLANAIKAFSEALGSKAKIPEKKAEVLTKLLELAEEKDKGSKIYKRFHTRLNPKVEEIDFAEALGF